MVAFQLDIVEILFHGPHMIACCALGDVRQTLQHRVVDPCMLAIDLLFAVVDGRDYLRWQTLN